MPKLLCIFRQLSSFIATNTLFLVYWMSKNLIPRLISLPPSHRLLCGKVAIKMEPTSKHFLFKCPFDNSRGSFVHKEYLDRTNAGGN